MRTKKTKKKTYKRRAATMNEMDTYLTIDGIAYKDERLKDFNIKALYCRIKMYINLKPDGSCFASNETLSKYIGKSPTWIKEKIAFLKELKYIYEESFDGRQRHLKLYKAENSQLKISCLPAENRLSDPIVPLKEDLKIIKEISQKKSSSQKNKSSILKEKLYFDFNKFWKVYPRKVAKPSAQKTWNKIYFKLPSMNIILSAIQEQKKSDQWQDKKYIPHPSTWLNAEQWNDEIIITGPKKSDVPVKDRKIIDMIQKDYHPFTDTQLLLTIPKMRKAYKETKTAPGELTDLMTFVWEYVKYLKKQEWITDPHPLLFRPDGKVWGKFIDDLKENKMIM